MRSYEERCRMLSPSLCPSGKRLLCLCLNSCLDEIRLLLYNDFANASRGGRVEKGRIRGKRPGIASLAVGSIAVFLVTEST